MLRWSCECEWSSAVNADRAKRGFEEEEKSLYDDGSLRIDYAGFTVTAEGKDEEAVMAQLEALVGGGFTEGGR